MLQQEQKYQGYEADFEEEEDQEYEEEELETLYVYAYDPEEESVWKMPTWKKEQIIAALMGVFALALIVSLCCIPTGQRYIIQTITVPAYLHTQVLTTDIAIIPTGKKEYPATRAIGILTIYNGSLLSQQLPANFTLTTSSGVEVATSQAVLIPGANLPSLGIATVPAYAVVSGSQGNIQPDAVQATYGVSIEIKNLSAFTGGQDISTKTFITAHDKTTALETARKQLSVKQLIGLQNHPCTENISQKSSRIVVTWFCQYATYQAPHGIQVLSVHLSGISVVLTVKIVARSITTHFVK